MTTSTDIGIELEAHARYATFPNEQAWLQFACDLRGFVASQKDRGYDIPTVTMKIIELCAMMREANEPPLMVYVNYDIAGVACQTRAVPRRRRSREPSARHPRLCRRDNLLPRARP
jgi:hypothetical protein